MTWTKRNKYRFDRDDGKAVISASRHGGTIMYSVWIPDPEAMQHPKGWRCATVVRSPHEARTVAEELSATTIPIEKTN